MALGQYVRSCGNVSPLSSQGTVPSSDPTAPLPPRRGYLDLVPSVCVAERYDSNVFFAPHAAGVKRDDFVTDINPNIRVNHNGEYATGYLDIGGFGETYVRNSNLNFIGTIDSLDLNLDSSIKRLLPNASLSITDYLRYTPTPPGFSNPAAGTSPGSPVNIQNTYAQGILAYRTNNLINNSNVATSYAITPTTSLNASYAYAIIRFGSSPVTNIPLALFDTTTQTGTLGGKTRLSSLDTINVIYSHAQQEFTPHTTSTISASAALFKVDTATLKWSRTLTPYLTTEVGGGGIVINPGFTTYALNASLLVNLPANTATLSYARSANPSYIAVGQPVTSNIVSLSAVQKLAQQWQLAETANYGHSSGGSGLTAVSFTTYSGTVDLYYWVTKIWSTALSFDYINFNQEFGATKYNFDRYAVTLSVKASWN